MPSIASGTKTVTTAGTRVALVAAQSIAEGVVIVARIANTGAVFVGDVTVASTTNEGLQPGDQITIPGPINLETIYIDAATSGDKVDYYATIR